jgi:SAM-dependent methyltransferase
MAMDETHERLARYFAEKLAAFGPTPQGVDYNGPEAQALRFEQLVKVIDPGRPFSIVDYGCGYGALFDFLHGKGWEFEYHGVDVIERMVEAGRDAHRQFPNARFTSDERELPRADYLVASAIFNVKLDAQDADWRAWIVRTLGRMNELCTRGFSFNMLTRYSDPERMAGRPDLYYGDPTYFFDHCKTSFSRDVALLHDYGLYDFTILVRKDV